MLVFIFILNVTSVFQVDKYLNIAYRNLLSTDRGFFQTDEDRSNCFEAHLKSILLRMLSDLDGSSVTYERMMKHQTANREKKTKKVAVQTGLKEKVDIIYH